MKHLLKGAVAHKKHLEKISELAHEVAAKRKLAEAEASAASKMELQRQRDLSTSGQ